MRRSDKRSRCCVVYLLCCALLVTSLIAACGDSGPAANVVAQVDRYTITRPELEHWTDVEAVLAYETEPKRVVPAGVVPDPPSYDKCIH